MLRSCGSLTTVNNINSWNVSGVTSLSGMFYGDINFNDTISGWNVSNVTNFIDFMTQKTYLDFSKQNYDALLNGWSSRPVKPNLTVNFGSTGNGIRYTIAGQPGRNALTNPATNNWVITDGGLTI
jgi:surface protein